MSNCIHVQDDICLLATKLSGIATQLSPEKCAACQRSFTPRSVNSVTCSMARTAQIDAGLIPSPKLLDCVYGELNGPGTELSLLLKWWQSSDGDCGCDEHSAMMNVWGTVECRKNIDIIVGWLMNSYKKTKIGSSLAGKFLGHLVVKSYAKRLVNRAIKNAEYRQMRVRNEANRGS